MTVFEIPTRFPYQASAAYDNERFGSAERRRMQILQNNRLASRGQHAFHLIGNKGSEIQEGYDGDTGVRGRGSNRWKQIHITRHVKKVPGLSRCRMRVRYDYPEDVGWTTTDAERDRRAMLFQVTTRGYPFRDNAATSNHRGTVEFNKRNTTDLQNIVDLPCDPGGWETFKFFIKGGLTEELMDEGTYGINNTGTADNHTFFGLSNLILRDGTSSWNSDLVSAGHYLELTESGSQHDITAVSSDGIRLSIDPTSSVPISNQAYSIYQLHNWHINSVACYFYNRER